MENIQSVGNIVACKENVEEIAEELSTLYDSIVWYNRESGKIDVQRIDGEYKCDNSWIGYFGGEVIVS
ncbi:MAG TPA: hypothetical protein DC057_03370 [Spirochaetia bacterium]|nr:hypothetical protein [Spirochaetia bacterium]